MKDLIYAIVKSTGLSEPKIVPYLEPFMVQGSLTPVSTSIFDTEGNRKVVSLIPRLTANARLLPTATVDAVIAFIRNCKKVSSWSFELSREVEEVLKSIISFEFANSTKSDRWLENRKLFQRNGESRKFDDAMKPVYARLQQRYGNSEGCTSAEAICYGMSFTDLSKVFFLMGDSLLPTKRKVSEFFGIPKPDIFTRGLRAISENLRNLDAHLLPSYRNSIDSSFSEKNMIYPWISTKCNLGKYYGKLCFLVYITTNFSDNYCQFARKEIKALMLQMPKATVNYLGMPPNWSNEPLWSNI